jgi:uncharacterized membrane protein
MIGHIILTALLLIVLDTFWFSWSLPNVYQSTFTQIQGSPISLKISGGLVAWVLIASGLNYFAIIKGDVWASAFRGALLGFIVYGVYNATNYATFKDYPLSTGVIDTTWGTFASAFVSGVISYF